MEYYDKMRERIKKMMTKEIANDVKQLRTKEDYSWRAVCRDMAKKYPELKLNTHKNGGGFQLDGMILSEEAEIFLGKNAGSGWI
jgi:hypothetical protein